HGLVAEAGDRHQAVVTGIPFDRLADEFSGNGIEGELGGHGVLSGGGFHCQGRSKLHAKAEGAPRFRRRRLARLKVPNIGTFSPRQRRRCAPGWQTAAGSSGWGRRAALLWWRAWNPSREATPSRHLNAAVA